MRAAPNSTLVDAPRPNPTLVGVCAWMQAAGLPSATLTRLGHATEGPDGDGEQPPETETSAFPPEEVQMLRVSPRVFKGSNCA
jgi:hypothetical protein